MSSFKSIVAGILIPGCSLAADANLASAWPKEPKSFMGVDLHGDFLKTVAECPADLSSLKEPCRVATDSPDKFLIEGEQSTRVFLDYKLFAYLSGDRIEKLVFTGSSRSSAIVADMLRTDYGTPSESISSLVTMQSGATFNNEILRWQGKSVSISSQRNNEDLGTYSVTFVNTPMTMSELPDKDEQRRSADSQR